MAVKLFTGLGLVTTSPLEQAPEPVVGSVSVPSVVSALPSGFDQPARHVDPARVSSPVSSVSRPALVHPGRRFAPDEPRVRSATSAPAPYETIFHDLEFDAVPTYNFWTEDESTGEGAPQGDRKLEAVPRYITLTWTPAPDLPRVTRHVSRGKSSRDICPVKFALEDLRGHATTTRGISSAPEHLQPAHFDTVAASLANGFLSPGVIHAVVELPAPPGHPIPAPDEGSFLTSPATRGLPLHEVRASVDQATDGALGAGVLGTDDLSVSSRAGIGGSDPTVEVRDVSSTPSLSFVARAAGSAQPAPADHLTSLLRETTRPPRPPRATFTRVSFVHPAVSGIVSEAKVAGATRPEHAESIVTLARFVPNLEVLAASGLAVAPRRDDVPSFPSPRSVPSLEYVGYVIEKYRRTPAGAFELVRELHVPSRETDSYVDCEVRYGELYRYRIRAVLRWTRPNDVGPSGKSKSIVSQHGSQTAPVLPQLSSYVAGEWCRGWRYATCVDNVPPPPPDELTVRPDSARRRVVVTLRFPDDSQLDISTLRLMRRLQDESGADLTGWEQVGPDFGPRNALYYDEDVQLDAAGRPDPSVRYVYAGLTLSKHGEVSTLSEQLGARLRPDHRLRGEHPVDFVSSSGVRLEYVGAFSTVPTRVERSELILSPVPGGPARVELAVGGRASDGPSALDDARYVLRVQSLDTGEVRDHLVNVRYDNLEPRTDELSSVVPAHVTPACPRRRGKRMPAHIPRPSVTGPGAPRRR